MTALAKPRMTVEQYLAWAEGRSGRFELHRGEVVQMSPQTAGHAEIKFRVHAALAAALQRSGLNCHFLPDGMTIKIDRETAYEPDAVVYCGEKLPRSVLIVPDPVIVIEVLSPSTRRIDQTHKLVGYFRVASVAHYLLIDPDQPIIVCYARGTGDTFLTRAITEGSVMLDPPGLELAMSDIYGQ